MACDSITPSQELRIVLHRVKYSRSVSSSLCLHMESCWGRFGLLYVLEKLLTKASFSIKWLLFGWKMIHFPRWASTIWNQISCLSVYRKFLHRINPFINLFYVCSDLNGYNHRIKSISVFEKTKSIFKYDRSDKSKHKIDGWIDFVCRNFLPKGRRWFDSLAYMVWGMFWDSCQIKTQTSFHTVKYCTRSEFV